ncbi:MAG TPA: VOC family protein [Vicinamibacterales bacterium]|nr:VOC family protein [Vicinamibacterales bacterium]
MIQRMSFGSIFVRDQDVAIDFYVNKLGFELTRDQTLPHGFRWVTVRPKGQTELQLILFKPTAGKQLTEDDVARINELMGKGAFGAGVFETADCQRTYDELKERGVEFASPPKEQFYGVEAVLKDPFGNWFSLTQPK